MTERYINKMPRPPISKNNPDDSSLIITKTIVSWSSKPVKEFHMKGGKYYYILMEIEHQRTEDQTNLNMDIRLDEGHEIPTQYSLVCYVAEEGIGSRIITQSAQSLYASDRHPNFVRSWRKWPSDKDLAETIYRMEKVTQW